PARQPNRNSETTGSEESSTWIKGLAAGDSQTFYQILQEHVILCRPSVSAPLGERVASVFSARLLTRSGDLGRFFNRCSAPFFSERIA
ncbi:MAG: hypothetical protein MN733_39120, partial [Nitrososphaera sp.]|nr:hypothetical protein [Nitrososphaera sp.]